MVYAPAAVCFALQLWFCSTRVGLMKSVSDNGETRGTAGTAAFCQLRGSYACAAAKHINFNLPDVSGDLRSR